MSIKYDEAIKIARTLIGTPYGDAEGQIDCINVIKYIIRKGNGGNKLYTTAGTSTLWRSFDYSGKYRDITWRQEGIEGAVAGMLAFKGKPVGDGQPQHIGLVTDVGTVIHASSVKGEVIESPLTAKEGWTLLAQHKYIQIAGKEKIGGAFVGYRAEVNTNKVNVRKGPGTSCGRIGQLNQGDIVLVEDVQGDWSQTDEGWIMNKYLTSLDEKLEFDEPSEGNDYAGQVTTTLANEDGQYIVLLGSWRVALD